MIIHGATGQPVSFVSYVQIKIFNDEKKNVRDMFDSI